MAISGLCCMLAIPAMAQQTETPSIYVALSSENLVSIDKELNTVDKVGDKNKTAYEGALRMKRAGLLKGAGNKLKEFKAGREKLENAISANGNSAEYRFLRIMIQENAPKILGYNDELEEDVKFLKEHFKSLPNSVQKVVLDYSKKSKILKPSDF